MGEAQDVELVYDFQSRWWGGRLAGLGDKPGASVFGKVFEIAEKDGRSSSTRRALCAQHVRRQRPVRVKVGGQIVEATAFTTRPDRRSDEGPVSGRFTRRWSVAL